MHIFDVRRELISGKTIFDLPLRVTFYARVSTSTVDQIHSLENQVSFFKNYIIKNNRWQFTDGYIDEGISGTSVNKRENFLKMIKDAKLGKFDLIVTKEISRFARNTLDSIKYTQELQINNVGVFFLNDNINTFEPDSELRLTIMSSLVQEEVRKISSRVKFGYKESIKKGRVLGNNLIWGYVKNDGKLVVVEEEAKIIRLIYDLYISGYGINSVCAKLLEMGYTNRKGNKFTYNTVKSILSNPKYKGYYVGAKTEKIDYRHNKRIKFAQKDWVMYEADDNVVPPIVDEDIWEKANQMLNRRREKFSADNASRYQDKTIYSGKIICKQHGTTYWRTVYKYKSGNREIWQCKTYRQQGKKKCDNPHLYSEDINRIVINLIQSIFIQKDDVIKMLMKIYKDITPENEYTNEITYITEQIQRLKNRKDKLLDLYTDRNIGKSEFIERNEDMNIEINQLKKQHSLLLNKQNNGPDSEDRFQCLQKSIDNILQNGSQKIIALILDKIEVYPRDDSGLIRLDVIFKTGLSVPVTGNIIVETEEERYKLAVGFC